MKRALSLILLTIFSGASSYSITHTNAASGPDGIKRISAPIDTNLVSKLWDREYNKSPDQLHNEGVDEFLIFLTPLWGMLPTPSGDGREAAFLVGRQLIALSKIEMNEADRLSYIQFIQINAFSQGRSVFEKADNHWGNLHIIDCCGAVSYMAKRLRSLGDISWELRSRYTYNMEGNDGTIVKPSADHPSNKELWGYATNAITLFQKTRQQHNFEDETLKTAIRLALASLKRDGIPVPLALEVEFHPLQTSIDAINETVKSQKLSFWTNLWIEMVSRGIDTDDYLWLSGTASPEKLISFFRADFEHSKTNRAVKPNAGRKFEPLFKADEKPIPRKE